MGSNIVKTRTVRTISSAHNLNGTASRTDQLVDSVHEVSKRLLVPQIQKMQANAISVDRRNVFLYFKKTTGRQCSCVDLDGMAEGRCETCYKVGIVGGFEKYGTHNEVLDITASFTGINIRGDYTRRPNILQLQDDAQTGSIVWDFELKQNKNVVDLLQALDYQPEGTSIVYSVWDGVDFIPMTLESVQQQLNNSTMRIKADLNRVSTTIKSPHISRIFLRYNLRKALVLTSDWPHVKDSRALSEFGIYNNWQTSEVNMDNTVYKITPEDFMFRQDRNEKWKIIESDRYDPLGLNIGHALTVRLIQSFEQYFRFPL